MPKRHRNTNFNHKTTGYTQRSCALSFSSVRRAFPALPGPIPQVEEAALFHGVTEASAEPDTGAILFGPSHITSTSVDVSLSLEVEDRNSRALGMGQKPDGLSHPSLISDNIIPLHTNNLKSPPLSAPSPSGDIPIKRPLILANSGIDPTTNVYGLSEVKFDERQEGAKERTTNTDLSETDSFYNSTFVDNIMSHPSLLFTDKTYKTQNISEVNG